MNTQAVKQQICSLHDPNCTVSCGDRKRVTVKDVTISHVEEWEYHWRAWNGDRVTHHPECYEVIIDWHGYGITNKFDTLEEAVEFADEAQPNFIFFATWEEVTCNGRYSCD